MSGQDRRASFSRLVEMLTPRNRVVRRYADDLREFADLRNAIVHERMDDRVIAEPNDWAVGQIEMVRELLVHPPTVGELFRRKVVELSSTQPVADALQKMYRDHYAQLPIYTGRKFSGLLTDHMVTRWLGSTLGQSVVDVHSTTIADVLQHGEDSESYEFVAEDLPVAEALDLYSVHKRRGLRLAALLITKDGQPFNRLLGIMTIWDVPAALRAIELNDRGAGERPG